MDDRDRQARADRRRLALAFAANAAMVAVGLVGWRLARSTALLGDALDMLADASGYAIAWLAVGCGTGRQRAAARWNGAMLMALGVALFGEVAHRWFVGESPDGPWIAVFAGLSLTVNALVLRLLSVYRESRQPHLRATWIDTRADVLVNIGVLLSGLLVALTGWRAVDLVAGAVLGAFVIHEGWEIWEDDHDDDDYSGNSRQ
ncbi:MAG: cation transporter [Burkholderiales bacterium]|nr:cation transporter [Burkholderiales bacterium]